MDIKNGLVYLPHRFVKRDICTENGIISENSDTEEILDADNRLVIPGLVEIHSHGAMGSDFSDATLNALETISAFELRNGVTSFLGTSMSYKEEELIKIFKNADAFIKENYQNGSKMRGINMEGPFISPEKCGAQKKDNILPPDIEMFERLNKICENKVRIVDVAPETKGCFDFISEISKTVKVSLAHTDADYECAKKAFECGADHVTHLFNAMPAFHHRKPGVIGAAFEKNAFAEIICDGIHIHPCAVKAAFAMFGADKMCLISDSMRACGMPDGDYSLGGQYVRMDGGKAVLKNGTLAGSTASLLDCLKRAVSFGIPIEDAVRAATENPAVSVGLFNRIGSLEIGKEADITILEKDFSVYCVILGGKIVYMRQ